MDLNEFQDALIIAYFFQKQFDTLFQNEKDFSARIAGTNRQENFNGKRSKQRKTEKRNLYSNPVSFRFKNFHPSGSSQGLREAKLELLDQYPLAKNVQFLSSRRNESGLNGWINFLNPKDCEAEKRELIENPIGEIVVIRDGQANKPWFREAICVRPAPVFRRKRNDVPDVDLFYQSDVLKYPCSNSTWFKEPNQTNRYVSY